MEEIELLKDFNSRIIEIYKEQNLVSISGKDGKLNLPNGKPLLSWSNSITRHRNCSFETAKINYQHLIDDLIFISDELVYFTAHLFLYRDYINDPLKDAVTTTDGQVFYPFYTNVAGKRYAMYLNVCYEKVYNYWDRIGDIIASFFPTDFTGNIYFLPVIRSLHATYAGNANFDWLYDFATTVFTDYNANRIKTVHTISHSTENKWKQLSQVGDEAKTRELSEKILGYPEEFKKMTDLCIEGVIRTLHFLEFVNKNKGYQCP
ncbi:Cthe_2314 family HEPN domain-containing protein [Chryseobacterium camelliae]|uniref:Cthe_2314 family HEPN domain-containing protein n=1 Tax=Chryseobacterium camelliae TaxID=1265445 RepID=UPI00285851D4|nr:Cthe_2314 family HEPN domain-containing protein [Chryseobacterium camelliae]MDR6516659.1 hypothetical protein [Chryseobacterium camelliae]